MKQIAERYLSLLVSQMEHDARIMSNGWVILLVVPLVWYFMAALLKWYILLAPLTVPLTFWPTVRRIAAAREWLKQHAKN